MAGEQPPVDTGGLCCSGPLPCGSGQQLMYFQREELELVWQKPYQGVCEYALQFSECLNKAYTAEDLVGPITLPQLIQTFINGLESETLR